jgi:predicted secreted protein
MIVVEILAVSFFMENLIPNKSPVASNKNLLELINAEKAKRANLAKNNLGFRNRLSKKMRIVTKAANGKL